MRRTIETISIPESTDLQMGRKVRHFAAVALAFLDWLELRMERQRSRRALMNLSDAQLKDIGLTRGDAYSEGTRWFWD